MLERISATARLMKQFNDVGNLIKESRLDRDDMKDAEELLAKVRTSMTYYENLSIGAKTDQDLLGLVKKMAGGAGEYKKNVQQGMQLLDTLQQQEIIDKLINMKDELGSHIAELNKVAKEIKGLRMV